MAVGTTLSRLTGFLRTMALAAALGVSATSDAYNTANTAPNMVFVLVAGGALSAAVVPLLVRSAEDRTELASALLGTTLLVGLAASVAVALVAPWIMTLLTAGARSRPGYEPFVALSSSWLRMFAPQVCFYALSVMAVAIMTSRRHLALGAVAPVATNLATIAAALVFISVSGGRVDVPGDVSSIGKGVLGWGTTAAVGAMAVIQFVGARRSEPGLRFSFAPGHPAVRELVRVGGWVSIYVITNQAGLAAVTAIANTVSGGITAYQWGFMVMQLPYAIVAVSLLSAAVPAIATADAAHERADRVEQPLRLTLRWLVPAAIGIVALAGPAARIVVGDAPLELVEAAVAGFALSLVPFSVFQMLVRTSYALGDRRLPATVNFAVNGVNVLTAAATVLFVDTPAQRVVGLAWSHASSYVVGCVLVGEVLRRRGIVRLRHVSAGVPRVLLATLPMAGTLVALGPWIRSHDGARLEALIGVAVAAGLAAAVYLAALHVLSTDTGLRHLRHRG